MEGLRQLGSALFEGQGRNKETTLRNLAAMVKSCLLELQDPIDFKDICAKIIDENSSKPFNINSVKRRIYECCKVLKMLGIV